MVSIPNDFPFKDDDIGLDGKTRRGETPLMPAITIAEKIAKQRLCIDTGSSCPECFKFTKSDFCFDLRRIMSEQSGSRSFIFSDGAIKKYVKKEIPSKLVWTPLYAQDVKKCWDNIVTTFEDGTIQILLYIECRGEWTIYYYDDGSIEVNFVHFHISCSPLNLRRSISNADVGRLLWKKDEPSLVPLVFIILLALLLIAFISRF